MDNGANRDRTYSVSGIISGETSDGLLPQDLAEVEFTAHNIRLDNGEFTKPDIGYAINDHPWFVSAKRVLDVIFPHNRENVRLADLGCLEGGYAVEFARLGFQVVGIDVRESNIAACNYVKKNTNLPNLMFIKDDVNNIYRYGDFDIVFCCGLLYHLDRPSDFLKIASKHTKKLLILQTHFSLESESNPKYAFSNSLSALTENEGLSGRWYAEFENDAAFNNREALRWSSWENRQSFWPRREYLIQAIYEAGFDLVMEQYDSLAPNIAEEMLHGYYCVNSRGTFVGVKTK
jgi:ubiquinone/menaquinone biosynthesis C-methylase UbiE